MKSQDISVNHSKLLMLNAEIGERGQERCSKIRERKEDENREGE